jgi:putative metallohydrolase (TIGR04338 family)
MRVTQQFKCYDAQSAIDDGERFETIEDMQRWVDDLRDTHWWHAQGYSLAVLRIEVDHATGENRRHRGVASYDRANNAGVCVFSPAGMCVRTVLHEVAHVLAAATHGSTSHNPAWARTYLTLVSCVMGPDVYLALQRSFDEHGVNYDADRAFGSGAAAFAL